MHTAFGFCKTTRKEFKIKQFDNKLTDTRKKRRNKTFVSNYLKDARENKVFQQSMETISWGETTKEVVQHGLEQGSGKEKHGSPNCNTQSLRKCERKRNGEFLNEEKKSKIKIVV